MGFILYHQPLTQGTLGTFSTLSTSDTFGLLSTFCTFGILGTFLSKLSTFGTQYYWYNCDHLVKIYLTIKYIVRRR